MNIRIGLDLVQLIDHVHHLVRFRATESGAYQFIHLRHDLAEMVARLNAPRGEIHQGLMHLFGQRHVTDEHHTGDILGGVGDRILQIEDFEQIAPVDGQEHAFRQMRAQLVLYFVRFAFQRVDPATDQFDIRQIMIQRGKKYARYFVRAFQHDPNMFL